MKEYLVPENTTLAAFTDNVCAQASFCLRSLLKNRDVRVNGVRVSSDVPLKGGDVVRYYMTRAQEEKSAFRIVYEDGNVLVADKESGVNSEAVFAALSRERECYFLHRLDRNTRGLMVFALNAASEKELLKAFREKSVEKIYHAACFGTFKKQTDVLTAYLKKDETKALVKVFDSPEAGAERIVTEYRVLKRERGYTLTEVVLHTGKTHQIRAHLSHIGCPVAGDTKYGFAEENRRFNLARQCLVAKRLQFHLTERLAYLNDKSFVSRFDADIFNG